jgi:hypothetical protein
VEGTNTVSYDSEPEVVDTATDELDSTETSATEGTEEGLGDGSSYYGGKKDYYGTPKKYY